jgi:hypothetical protein
MHLYLYRNPGTNVEKGLARRRTAEGKLWDRNVFRSMEQHPDPMELLCKLKQEVKIAFYL